jgi:hypothetical protein
VYLQLSKRPSSFSEANHSRSQLKVAVRWWDGFISLKLRAAICKCHCQSPNSSIIATSSAMSRKINDQWHP